MKNLIVFLSLIAITTTLSAQKKDPDRMKEKEEIEAMKVAFITQKINLTTQEAQLFWPIYNEYNNQKDELRKEQHQLMKKMMENKDNMSDEELEKNIDQLHIVLRQKELDIDKAYHQKFKEVLPIKKVAAFYKAEMDFKRELLKKLKGKNGPPHGGPGPR
ncbi:MAG: transcriptional regulator [Vicingaceae bacterium]